MANSLLTISMITREAIELFVNSNAFLKNIDRQYDKDFGKQGEKMRAIVDDIRDHCDEFYWLPLYGMGGAAKEAGWKPQPGNPGRLAAMRDPLPCWSVFTEGHVTKDGLLSACCFGHGVDDDMVMADLRQVSFMDGWNSVRYQELRMAHLAKNVSGTPCATCAAA